MKDNTDDPCHLSYFSFSSSLTCEAVSSFHAFMLNCYLYNLSWTIAKNWVFYFESLPCPSTWPSTVRVGPTSSFCRQQLVYEICGQVWKSLWCSEKTGEKDFIKHKQDVSPSRASSAKSPWGQNVLLVFDKIFFSGLFGSPMWNSLRWQF